MYFPLFSMPHGNGTGTVLMKMLLGIVCVMYDCVVCTRLWHRRFRKNAVTNVPERPHVFAVYVKKLYKFLWNFQLWFNLIFSEEIIQYSRTFVRQVQTSWNQAHAPLLVESFPKTPRTWSEASQFGGSHNYKRKQTTFLHW